MPGPETGALFGEARALKLGFQLSYAELTYDEDGRVRRCNAAILVGASGTLVGKYRNLHLPGHREHEPAFPVQHLEKRYFEVGDPGFPTFDAFDGRLDRCICNDRRSPENFRVMGVRGVELGMLGYNTPVHYPRAPDLDHPQDFHSHLSMQAGAYRTALGWWVSPRRVWRKAARSSAEAASSRRPVRSWRSVQLSATSVFAPNAI